MFNIPESALQELCQHLDIDSEFVAQCLQESVIEIHEINGRFDLGNGTVFRLRQLERICDTLNVDLSVALLLLELTSRVAELEEKIRLMRPTH